MTVPEHVGGPDAALIGEQLLGALSQGAVTLIADMSATKSCDHALGGALARAYQRAAASQAELRLVISVPDVQRLVTADGLDRLVSVYSSLEAALGARARGWAGTGARHRGCWNGSGLDGSTATRLPYRWTRPCCGN